MRLSTELHDSEVFKSFMEIAEKNNMMEKKAELLYPDYDISPANPELDIALSVTASEHNKLYHVHNEKGEDLIDAAHPGGGTETQLDVKPSDKLGLVETVVEQHKVLEEIARGTPSGKLASLSDRLVRLADKFDAAGFEVVADNLTATLGEIAEVSKKKIVVAEDGSEHHFEPEHIKARSPEEFRKDIASGNLRAQKMLNKVRSAKGLDPIREDGVMGRETLIAMNEAGIRPGSYNTWGELYSMLNKSLEGALSAQPRAREQAFDISRRENDGAPAQLPVGALELEKKDLPLPEKKPAPLMNDDGMDARSRDAQMLEQDAEDPAALRQKALEDAKRRLQEAELQKALKAVKPRQVPSAGLTPRDMAPPSTETHQLGKMTPIPTPSGGPGLAKKKDRPVKPHALKDVREVELTPNQYFSMQNK